jgi:hypothetical protein
MPGSVFLNSQPALSMSLHLPLNGSWSAELQVSSDKPLATGDAATIKLPGDVLYQGRVVRAGIVDERLNVRLTGGTQDWGQQVDLKHYKGSDGDTALRDLGVQSDAPLELDLPFWTRPPGTIGMAVQALATAAGVNWRVNPDGTIRIRDEAPFTVAPQATELFRDDRRGIVEVAPEVAAIMPGTIVGADQVGDVVYDFADVFRCRYYVQQRARLRGALERLVRWVTRDSLFLGQYTARVVAQAADGSLDLLPDDFRLKASGLQSVPIRHGLPGVKVKVPPGESVLLAFDAGDPRQPYAALWHEGQVLEVQIGGAIPVAMSTLTDANFQALAFAFNTHIHSWPGGLAPLPTTPPAKAPAGLTPADPVLPGPTASLLLKTL